MSLAPVPPVAALVNPGAEFQEMLAPLSPATRAPTPLPAS
jgi:hypothetical protein